MAHSIRVFRSVTWPCRAGGQRFRPALEGRTTESLRQRAVMDLVDLLASEESALHGFGGRGVERDNEQHAGEEREG